MQVYQGTRMNFNLFLYLNWLVQTNSYISMLLVDKFKHLKFVPDNQYLMKVFNAFKPTNVLSIPHFDIPVIILGKTFLINDY